MLSVSNVSLSFGKRFLFKDVSLKFNPGNCYGIIGANGAGKSTLLKILSGEMEADTGTIGFPPNLRMAVLQQNQFAYDEFTVLSTVIMGHKKLYNVMTEKDLIYSKADFSEADGMRASELEAEFAELGGWEAEAEAATLLDGLGIAEDRQTKNMSELEGGEKVRVLLAQALFGNPDLLLLDEPTNHLDLESIGWLEEFLYKFKNTVIVVSHDRHFLNQVCTHICDIDFGAVNMYVGNYDFWYETSQLLLRQRKDEKKRSEEKAAELKSFIMRFSSNASKSKQATSRQKLLEKLNLEDLRPSSRKFPYIAFKPERECGKSILEVKGLSFETEDGQAIQNFDLIVQPGDKVAFLGDGSVKSALFEILAAQTIAKVGSLDWGVTITTSYFPNENSKYFQTDDTLVQWLGRYSKDTDETYLRGFLGRMLFSGDEALKQVNVLSGGEKVRLMLSRMMMTGGNVLIMDEPTNHLDLESITALNNAMKDYNEVILFTSHDHQLNATVANRIIEFAPGGVIDRRMAFEEYLANPAVRSLRDEFYHGHVRMSLE